MEGAAFALRHNIEAAAAAGFETDSILCVGGGARSRLWNQIKADVLQFPVRVPTEGTGAPLGDAMAAGVAVGVFPGIAAAVKHVLTVRDEYGPNGSVATLYDELYRIYVGLYPAVAPSFRDLAALATSPNHG